MGVIQLYCTLIGKVVPTRVILEESRDNITQCGSNEKILLL